MAMELSLACPTLHREMTTPDSHQMEPQSSIQLHPPCTLHRDSAQITIDRHNLRSHLHDVSSSYRSRCSCAGACIDVNQMPSSSQCKEKVAIDGIALTLALAHDTTASSNEQKRDVCHSRSRELGSRSCTEYTSVSFDDQEKTLNEGSSHEERECRCLASTRKKLRLSKEESALLEERFKEHSNLTPKQKNALAKQLNLRPRQVEVWFQNRRARTKLKRTESDCDLLKKCCASLSEENMRLQMEVAQLRALKVQRHSMTPHHSHLQMSDTRLTMCPRCVDMSISTCASTPSSSTTATSNS